MCVCVCMPVCTCMRVCVCAVAYACTYARICEQEYLYSHRHIYIYPYVHRDFDALVYAYMNTTTPTRVWVHMHVCNVCTILSGSVARLQKHGQQLACWASTEISEKMLLAYRQSAPCPVPRFRVALLAQGFSGRNTSERLFRTCNPSLDNLLSVQVCRGTMSQGQCWT